MSRESVASGVVDRDVRVARVRARRANGIALLALAIALPSPAHAQYNRWFIGGGFALTEPQGEFGRLVDEGFGFNANLMYRLDPDGILALRLDAGVVTYGSETFQVPLSRTVQRVLVDVTTRNNIFLLGAGPQLSLATGPVRPYLNGSVGLGYFFTESSVRGSRAFASESFARTTNFDDLSFAYGVGGGLGIPVKGGYHPIHLLLDAQYRNHGRTRYLREGSIQEDPSGRVLITPLESQANLLLFLVGVSVGL
ncbi:MAG: outer membrane beta-barrel protein [Gemmatimonadota bacterium]